MGKTISIYLTDKELCELESILNYFKHMLPDVNKSMIIGACIHCFFTTNIHNKHKN